VPKHRMPALDKLKQLERSSLYTLTREAFTRFQEALEAQGRHSEALIISQASTHWLRHTAIKRIVTLTNDIVMAQRLARHDDLSTTGVYAEATVEELAAVFEKFQIGGG